MPVLCWLDVLDQRSGDRRHPFAPPIVLILRCRRLDTDPRDIATRAHSRFYLASSERAAARTALPQSSRVNVEGARVFSARRHAHAGEFPSYESAIC